MTEGGAVADREQRRCLGSPGYVGEVPDDDTPAEQPATGKSPGLSVVRGAAAPSEVPPAPKAEEAA